MESLLRIENLSVDFVSDSAVSHALKNISINVNRGEIVALVGESGSGKSVTSLSVLQLLPAPPAKYVSGKILFSEDGKTPIDLLQSEHKSLRAVRGNKIAMIFQEPMTSLNPVLTCGDQICEAILAHKEVSQADARKRGVEWFAKVHLPSPERIMNRYPHELSGGQKQRVMIAMAMCCHPSLLICDEPTTALDVTVQKTILQLIKELQAESDMGVIFITHDLGVVAEVADRAVVMYKGEIVEQNSVRNLFTNPQHAYTRALLACRPVNHPRGKRLPVVSDFMNKENESIPEFKTTENPDDAPSLLKSQENKKVLFTISNLAVWFPTKKTFLGKTKEFVKAVDDVSFDVFEGETLGLVGESGCGKTTLGRAMLRLIEPTHGKIVYNNTDLLSRSRKEMQDLRRDIQIIFQDPYSSLNPRMTIGSAIAEPMKVHHEGGNERSRKEKVVELLRKVDLRAEHFNRYPHEFSGGQRQRIVIARALSLNPSFVVCDESVSALDVSVQAQVLNLLNDLKKEFGFTIIFISHDLSVVRYVSDRIMVMNKGRIEESGDADEIYFNPKKEYTQRLISSIPQGIIV